MLASPVKSDAQSRAAQTLEEAFPKVDPLITPLGNQVLVQLRTTKKVTAGGLILTEDTQDYDASVVRVGLVLAMGAIAYKNRESMTPWPEGAWVKVGEYVRVPTHASTESWRIFAGEKQVSRGTKFVDVKDWVHFAMFNDYDIKGLIKGNVLDVVDYV